MSILIKGMEMPKNCKECFACKAELSPEKKVIYVCCFAKTDCPLVPVPPHGRLGDLDALVHDLDDDIENDQRVLDEMDFVGKEREHVQFDKDCKQNCLWYLSNAPTVIPADESDMDSFIHMFEEDDEEDEMDSFIHMFED